MTYHCKSVLRVFTHTSLALLASASFLACDSDDAPGTDTDGGAPDSGGGIVDEKDSSTPPVKPPPNNNDEDAGDVPVETDSGAAGDAGLGDAGDAGDAGPTVCVDAPASLVGWWQGEGDAVNAMNDEAATLPASETFANGRVGQGFVLDGANDYVAVAGDSISLSTDGLTLAAWIKPTALSTERGYVISNMETTAAGYALVVTEETDCGPDGPSVLAFVRTSEGILRACSTTTVELDEFHHVAAKYSAETGTLTVYVDGEAVGASEVAPGSELVPGSSEIQIGARPLTSGRGFFSGVIDEAQIFDSALSNSQLQSIFAAGAAGVCE